MKWNILKLLIWLSLELDFVIINEFICSEIYLELDFVIVNLFIYWNWNWKLVWGGKEVKRGSWDTCFSVLWENGAFLGMIFPWSAKACRDSIQVQWSILFYRLLHRSVSQVCSGLSNFLERDQSDLTSGKRSFASTGKKTATTRQLFHRIRKKKKKSSRGYQKLASSRKCCRWYTVALLKEINFDEKLIRQFGFQTIYNKIEKNCEQTKQQRVVVETVRPTFSS